MNDELIGNWPTTIGAGPVAVWPLSSLRGTGAKHGELTLQAKKPSCQSNLGLGSPDDPRLAGWG